MEKRRRIGLRENRPYRSVQVRTMAVRPYRRYRPSGKEVLPREEVHVRIMFYLDQRRLMTVDG